jgi:predicted nucleic acid-binding protein
LLAYPELTEPEALVIRDFLAQFESISITLEIEEIAISLKKQRRIKLPGAILAAAAISLNACFVTRNTKDFQDINQLRVYNPWD